MSENHNGKKEEKRRKKKNKSWIIILVATTIIFSVVMSSISTIITQRVNLLVAICIVIGIVLVGIIFDIIGIAVAVADETPFHAMAASKVKAAKYAIKLTKNASKVATFCNDVVGDVCGVISGSTSAYIVVKLQEIFKNSDVYVLGILVSAIVAGLTVSGKGLGKSYAISKGNTIIYKVALIEYHILRVFDIIGIGLSKIFKKAK